MSRDSLKTMAAFRFIAILLVVVLGLEFVVASDVEAMNYSRN